MSKNLRLFLSPTQAGVLLSVLDGELENDDDMYEDMATVRLIRDRLMRKYEQFALDKENDDS